MSNKKELWKQSSESKEERAKAATAAAAAQPVCQSIPRVVQFKPSHFPTQEERWCLSEMKKHAGSQQMNCLELDNKSILHCGSIWSCQCSGLGFMKHADMKPNEMNLHAINSRA